jgi:hypothetical protein
MLEPVTQPPPMASASTVADKRESKVAPLIGSSVILFHVRYWAIFVRVSSTWACAERSRELRENPTTLNARTARTNNLAFLVEKVSTLSKT